MKILIICSSIIPCGGTEKAIANMIRLFSKAEYNECCIVSICSCNNEKPAFEISAPIKHMNIESLSSGLFGKIKWYFNVIPQIRKILEEVAPDIIFSIGHNISIMMPFSIHNTPVYACEHIDYTTIPNLSRFFMKCLYPHLTGVVALSKTAKTKMKSLNRNIVVIPNSIKTHNLNIFDNKDLTRFIMVGRISPEKGYDRIIPIAKALKEELTNFSIDIYGDGPMRAEIEKQIKSNNLQDVIKIYGFEKNIAEKYKGSSILLLTSYTEALPMVIIEANSYGLPVIAYDNEGARELIRNDENGFTINNNDVNSYVDKILYLVNNTEKLTAMRYSSYKMSEQYSEDIVNTKWLDLFKNYK